ncbi:MULTISPECIES: hypothetical protein [unclassified Paenibacillus]|uniref:hypothetical protein n=1 Tax=unclassified Paenibacillus TaxID=185978 RepID=UPI0021B669A4|nr:hypothetical protein [Paenibacillus sp. 32O-W]
MKKLKKPGDNISLKTKKNEAPAIIDWINSQTNLMDSIRYLIENEIRENGVRNLQNYIPAERALGVIPAPSAMAVSMGALHPGASMETAAAAETVYPPVGQAVEEAMPVEAEHDGAPSGESPSGESLGGKRTPEEIASEPADASAVPPQVDVDPAASGENAEVPIDDEIDEEDIESWL